MRWNWNKFRGGRDCLKWNRRDLSHLNAALAFVDDRRVVVQAGGNLGIFPKRLSEEFDAVYTFEPDQQNFFDMVVNAPEPNIIKMQAALGCERQLVSTVRERRDGDITRKFHEGVTYTNPGGIVPTIRIDDLGLEHCDMIYLDIEGYELNALLGALDTIKHFRPVIALEINGNIKLTGKTKHDIFGLMRDLGYINAMKIRTDNLYVPGERKMPTVEDYRRVFQQERANKYPEIDTLETMRGFAIERSVLEEAAYPLACPVKVNPPNWQHGRVLYASLRSYIARTGVKNVRLLDIGTAKGFSALIMQMALEDSLTEGQVFSVDVMDPAMALPRNSVREAEEGRSLTIAEYMKPWPCAEKISFLESSGIDWLTAHEKRVHFAFVDGKHNYNAVHEEAGLLENRQVSGDMILFDDIQIEGVARAVKELKKYTVQYIEAKRDRFYAVATRL